MKVLQAQKEFTPLDFLSSEQLNAGGQIEFVTLAPAMKALTTL